MSDAKVVVWDPCGEVHEGELIDGQAAKVFEARGGIALPIHVPLLGKNGASGWVKRCYGDGASFEMTSHRRRCPLVLHVARGCDRIHWAARLIRNEGEQLAGGVRLTTDSGQSAAGLLRGGVSSSAPAVQVAELEKPDEEGGWVARGESRFNAVQDGFVALGLYGAMAGARVRWLAVSQSR